MNKIDLFNVVLWASAIIVWSYFSYQILKWIYDGICYLSDLPDLFNRVHQRLNDHDGRLNLLDNKYDFIEDNKHTLHLLVRKQQIRDHIKTKGRRK